MRKWVWWALSLIPGVIALWVWWTRKPAPTPAVSPSRAQADETAACAENLTPEISSSIEEADEAAAEVQAALAVPTPEETERAVAEWMTARGL